jgi:heme oxygenase
MISAAHAALREATAAAHDRLDGLFARFDLADARAYGAFLQAHAAAVLPIEEWLDRAGAGVVVADWPARRRTALIAADLASLGLVSRAGHAFAAPETPAAVAGVLYVIEGSRLGGRYLARRLGTGLPHGFLDPGAGQPSWPALLAAIDRVLADPATHPPAIAAANEVFARFEAAGRDQLQARAA